MDGQRPSGELIFTIIYTGIHTTITISWKNYNIYFWPIGYGFDAQAFPDPSTIIINNIMQNHCGIN